MKIVTFPIRPMQENSYFFYNENSLDGVVIDPGGDEARLVKFAEDNELTIRHILLTHGHYDHILAVETLRQAFGASVSAHQAEAPVLTDPRVNMSSQMTRVPIILEADNLLADGDIITFGQDALRLIHTPGHTPGSCCFYSEKEKVLFTGDTLFFESVGRTDFALGSQKELYHAIEQRLFVLPEDVWVYPGHGQASSIGHERRHNPFLGVSGG